MAVLTHSRHHTPAAWPLRVAGFVLGFTAGLLLTAVLTRYVWPLVLPMAEVVVPSSTGWAAAVFMGVVCGVAGTVIAAARQSR